jgi:AraC family transcriptional regulator
MDEPLALEKLSEITGISAFHLQREFTRTTGHSPARRAQLLRLKRASMRLVFQSARSITDVALEAGYQNAESFSRAFQKQMGQSPSQFRRTPDWRRWRTLFSFPSTMEPMPMQVDIVQFPVIPVAVI